MYNYNVNPIDIRPFMQGMEMSRQRDKEQQLQDLRQRVASGDQSAFKEYSMVDPQGAAAFQALNKPEVPELNAADINEFYKDAKSLYPLLEKDDPRAVVALENMKVKYSGTPFVQAVDGFIQNYQVNPDATLQDYRNFLSAMPQPEADKPKTPGEKIQNYEYYQQLLKTNPEGAKRFAQSANLNPQERAEAEVEVNKLKISDKEKIERLSGFAANGVGAADGMRSIKTAIGLLGEVKTGGVQNAMLAAKRFFGIDAADEGELSFLLGKNVLRQLKETFGAAFTVEEVKRLSDIEASFGRSPETNIRLLNRALASAERAAKRGKRAAIKIGDDFTADEIQLALDNASGFEFSLTDDKPSNATNPSQGGGVINWDDL